MIDQADLLPLALEDPRQISRYAVQARLGAGGQGVVYLGRDPSGRQVAIKVLRADGLPDPQARARFAREVEAARSVPQAHTAAILDADVLGERPYIVSEYVPGLSLQATVERNGVFTGNALERLATHTITALAAIHGARVVHRDFKPANVLIGPDGPRVVDFGIARALESDGHMTSSMLGTPPYMAPEQLREQPAGPHTDVFAWAATVVFAATGGPPFGQGPFPAVAHRILHAAPNLDGVPAPLRDVLARCLAKNPGERPTSLQVLQSLIGHGTVVEPEAQRLALQQAPPPGVLTQRPIGGPGAGAGGGPGARAGTGWSGGLGTGPGAWAGGGAGVEMGGGAGESPTAPARRRTGLLVGAVAAVLVVFAACSVAILRYAATGDADPAASRTTGAAAGTADPASPGNTGRNPTPGTTTPAGARHRWLLHEGTGTRTADSAGPAELLLRTGTRWAPHSPAPNTNALLFDGVKAYAATEEAATIDPARSFTVTARARIDRLPEESSFAAVLSQDSTEDVFSYTLQHMWCTGAGEPDGFCPAEGAYWSFSVHGTSDFDATRVVSRTTAELGAWVRLTAVHDQPAGEIRIYVNGRPEGAKAIAEPTRQASGPFYLGRATYVTAVDFWPGAVADVALWDRALSDEEISNTLN
ncbi:hypothetical protein GCM10009850_050890 [Nonomuraea monospora]|uniref:Protein kinase domain-containing protein n=1 Tax=Nonomuraea monospora TaxID=568818 RepID=A0ABP5PG61_9ACTN